MLRKIGWTIGIALALLVTSTGYAQGPSVQEGDPSWQASYWNNSSLSGAPAWEETVAHLNWDWGYGSPHHYVATEGFSARWTRTAPFPVGTYRFTATADDGIRVYVDQRPIIDEWRDQPARTYSTELVLAGGPHEVVVEYYEQTGVAVAKLSWTRVSDEVRAWQGEYFSNPWLSGSPAIVRGDENVDFNWGYGSPGAGIPSDSFSVRWTRTARLESGNYRFTTTTDDGVRLWVNDHLLIDEWRDQSSRSHSGTIYVSGDVSIRMEYYERGGVASARLTWTRMDDEPPPPPGVVIVDNADPGFRKGGSPRTWHTAQEGHGGTLIWTQNNDRVWPNYNWVRWYPQLEAGRYEVYVYIPAHYATTGSARYWVAHRDGFTLRPVNQGANGGRWVSLGTFTFDGAGDEYVSLSDVTNEPYLSRLIAFDAIQWVRR